MNLIEKPKLVNWPSTHYLYVEKIGPFLKTAPQAWQKLQSQVPEILNNNKITGYMSLYKARDKMIYRAGVTLSEAPKELPKEVKYTKFKGGKYAKFVLKGSYSDLPEACGHVYEIVTNQKLKLRNNFNIESYVNDPRKTPEKDLITEILIAIA